MTKDVPCLHDGEASDAAGMACGATCCRPPPVESQDSHQMLQMIQHIMKE